MHIDTYTTISKILAICILFFYNIHVFFFLREMAKKTLQNYLYAFAFSLINITCVFFYNHFITNYLLLFYATILLVTLECMVFLKMSLRQALFCSSILSLHIALTFLPIPILLSDIFDATPRQMISLEQYRYISMIVLFLVLELMLCIVSKIIKKESFFIVSTAKVYSEAFIFVCIFICTYIAIDCTLLITDEVYSGQLTLSLVTSIFTLIAHYSILLYTIDLVSFAKHKRQSDLAEYDYNQVLIKKDEIVRKNTTDDLTALYNRKFIYKNLNELCISYKNPFAILYLDVNGLKFVNDTYGHEEGDRFLKNVAIAIRKAIRQDDLPARIGGDEFIIILDNILESDIGQVIERIDANMRYFEQEEKYPISASIGFLYVTQELRLKGYKYLLEKVDGTMRDKKAKFYKDKEDMQKQMSIEEGV